MQIRDRLIYRDPKAGPARYAELRAEGMTKAEAKQQLKREGRITSVVWLVDYKDRAGKRHQIAFPSKAEADAAGDKIKGELGAGTHTPVSASKTVKEAADIWLANCTGLGGHEKLERSTIEEYQRHVDLYIAPKEGDHGIGNIKLAKLTRPDVTAFLQRLADKGLSPAMVRKVRVSLGALLNEAVEQALVGQNVARIGRRRSSATTKRHRKRLKAGIDFPTKDEIDRMIEAADDKFRPALMTLIYTGIRTSELRGMTWDAIDFKARELRVYQRADRWNVIGPPKSDSSNRTIEMADQLVKELRAWKIRAPKGDLRLAFPNSEGGILDHGNLYGRAFGGCQERAKLMVPTGEKDEDGNPILRQKYGLHALRHAAASLFFGKGFDAKEVQELLGHSSIAVTMDIYVGLIPDKKRDRERRKRLNGLLA